RGFDAIIITHHHGDHMAHLEPHARATLAPLYLHSGISADTARRKFEVRGYEPGDSFTIGALTIRSVPLPHDAPQVALSVTSSTRAFGMATDLGHVTKPLIDLFSACDAALVESNYCTELLHQGPYPMHLKRRVSGDLGHLSNDQTAELAVALLGSRLGRLYLCHLSKVNNSPARALMTVQKRVPKLDVSVILHGEPQLLEIEARHPTRRRAEQLSLCF
ncbi:MAG: MBL fold metallo-hydrolase, partial [Polyangiaceae bacterium]